MVTRQAPNLKTRIRFPIIPFARTPGGREAHIAFSEWTIKNGDDKNGNKKWR